MLQSMTGFGQASRVVGEGKVFMDVKSVNHRYCEVAIRIPKEWACYEDSLRKTVLQSVKRGRVDVYVSVEREAVSHKAVSIDWALADGYMQASGQLKKRYGFTQKVTLTDLLQMPDLVQLKEDRAAPSDSLEQELCDCLMEAVAHLSAMRKREGAFLANDLSERLQTLIRIHAELQYLAPRVVRDYAAKLKIRIQDLLADQTPVDENRLAAEIAVFADRSNVEEELTRLQSHFEQFSELLAAEEPVGRKLDFLIQEMNREVNTIGSKANHSEFSVRVIDLKAELEKIREQIQNIE